MKLKWNIAEREKYMQRRLKDNMASGVNLTNIFEDVEISFHNDSLDTIQLVSEGSEMHYKDQDDKMWEF